MRLFGLSGGQQQQAAREMITWKIPGNLSPPQSDAVQDLLRAYANDDIVERFNRAGVESTVVLKKDWADFIDSIVEDTENAEVKKKLKKWKFAKSTDSADVLLDATVRGSTFEVSLRAFQPINDQEVLYKEASIQKELEVVHKNAKPELSARLLCGMCTLGLSEIKWQEDQNRQDGEEERLIRLTRDDAVVKNFIAKYCGPALKSFGINVIPE